MELNLTTALETTNCIATSDGADSQAGDSAMPFHVLPNNPLNPLQFPPNFFQVALICSNAPRQTACSVAQDVVYGFALSFVRASHCKSSLA